MAWYVGVDLGATNIKAVVSDESGTVVGRGHRQTPHGPDGDAVTDAVVGTVSAATEAASVDARDIVACGVGSAGPLDTAAGVVAETPNFGENVDRVPLVDPLTSHLDAPVTLHNDAVAALIGERFYAVNSPENMVYLTISSGIGAGIAVGGNVLSGWDGNAAEVGHWVVDPDGLTCGCGIDGHWEGYCSGNNIPRHAKHIHEQSGVPTDLPIDDPDFTAADVFAAAGEDPLADEVLEACNRYNALAVSNLVHAYAPEVISIGGAVAWNNPEQVVDPMRERVPDRVITNVPDIRLTSLGEETVVRGALASVLTANAGIHSVKNG